MIFDRITLINAYNALKLVQDSDGDLKNILFNRKTKSITKTMPRFTDLKALKTFINEKYPYISQNKECLISSEGMWTLLSFELYSKSIDLKQDLVLKNNKNLEMGVQPVSKHATFIDNIRGILETKKPNSQNKLTASKIQDIFKPNKELNLLFQTHSCIEYIENQSSYVNTEPYIQAIKNESYEIVVEEYYKPTRNF